MALDNISTLRFAERQTLCLITGASRGLGKAIAMEFAKMLTSQSVLVLLSKSKSNLDSARQEIQSKSHVNVVCETADLEQLANDQKSMDEFIPNLITKNSLTSQAFNQIILVHNAGTIGDLSKNAIETICLKEIHSYFDVNILSVIGLNSSFWQAFKPYNIKYKYCINISSLTAVQPFRNHTLYCTGKAARDMFFRVMAAEETDIRVLNYAPGPLDTDMSVTVRNTLKDPELLKAFNDLHENSKYVDPFVSAAKLVSILCQDSFESGCHIDFYDDV